MIMGRDGSSLDLGALKLETFALQPPEAAFELELTMEEADDRFVAWLQYSTELFDRSTVERMAGCFRTLLDAIVYAPGHSVGSLSRCSALRTSTPS